MKKFLIAATALSIIASAGAASAQPAPRHQEQQRSQARHDDHRQDQYERRAERKYKADRYKAPRGYQAKHWRRGDQLPSGYRAKAYVVDHRRYALAPPPRGYNYVRVGNDVMLTSITTGVISSVILQLFN